MKLPGSQRFSGKIVAAFGLTPADLAGVRSAVKSAWGATGVVLADLASGAAEIVSDWRTLLATYLVPMLGFGTSKRRRVQIDDALNTPAPGQEDTDA